VYKENKMNQRLINTKKIILDYLNKKGYDGLYNAHTGCSCLKDDLMPCDLSGLDCEPGYKVELSRDNEFGQDWEIKKESN
jgi:hypothetical protein